MIEDGEMGPISYERYMEEKLEILKKMFGIYDSEEYEAITLFIIWSYEDAVNKVLNEHEDYIMINGDPFPIYYEDKIAVYTRPRIFELLPMLKSWKLFLSLSTDVKGYLIGKENAVREIFRKEFPGHERYGDIIYQAIDRIVESRVEEISYRLYNISSDIKREKAETKNPHETRRYLYGEKSFNGCE